MRVRIGGFRPDQQAPSPAGDSIWRRTFSVQGRAFVLVGWPTDSLAGAGRPLDDLRREMNAANVLHRYHVQAADVDNDLHLVVGHHAGAPPGALVRATAAVRDKLAADPWTWPSAWPTSRSSRPTLIRWRRRYTSATSRPPRRPCSR